MDGQRRFAVIGTDPRLAAAGRALARAGFAVGGPEQTALADYILLPLPLDESRTPLAELLRAAKPGALALGGKLSAQARQIAAEAGVELVDYFAREELILCNAIPTAEGCMISMPMAPFSAITAISLSSSTWKCPSMWTWLTMIPSISSSVIFRKS